MSDYNVPAVGAFNAVLWQILRNGKSIQQHKIAEPPMSKADLGDIDSQITNLFPAVDTLSSKKKLQWPVIETACRETYNDLVVSSNSKQS